VIPVKKKFYLPLSLICNAPFIRKVLFIYLIAMDAQKITLKMSKKSRDIQSQCLCSLSWKSNGIFMLICALYKQKGQEIRGVLAQMN